MVNDFTSKLQEMTHNGILTCSQIVRFAKSNKIALENMKPLLHAAGIKVKDCEQTCLSLKCTFFK